MPLLVVLGCRVDVELWRYWNMASAESIEQQHLAALSSLHAWNHQDYFGMEAAHANVSKERCGREAVDSLGGVVYHRHCFNGCKDHVTHCH